MRFCVLIFSILAASFAQAKTTTYYCNKVNMMNGKEIPGVYYQVIVDTATDSARAETMFGANIDILNPYGDNRFQSLDEMGRVKASFDLIPNSKSGIFIYRLYGGHDDANAWPYDNETLRCDSK